MQIPRQLDDPSKPLTTRESVELFQETVETAKQGIQQSLAGTGKAGEALRPKLTVDLKSRNLGQIPSEVVTIIKQDVERWVCCDHVGSIHSLKLCIMLMTVYPDCSSPTTNLDISPRTSPHVRRSSISIYEIIDFLIYLKLFVNQDEE